MQISLETRNTSATVRCASFCHCRETQIQGRILSMLLNAMAHCAHAVTQEKSDPPAEEILQGRAAPVFAGGLRGSSVSFPSNALFVDKSKLMTVNREAFGGKILLTLLRLNLTTEQDTSSCRNDRLL